MFLAGFNHPASSKIVMHIIVRETPASDKIPTNCPAKTLKMDKLNNKNNKPPMPFGIIAIFTVVDLLTGQQ